MLIGVLGRNQSVFIGFLIIDKCSYYRKESKSHPAVYVMT